MTDNIQIEEVPENRCKKCNAKIKLGLYCGRCLCEMDNPEYIEAWVDSLGLGAKK